MKDFYSLVAPFYSGLARVVFGDVLKQAKLAYICPKSDRRILLIGGGTGEDYSVMASEMSGDFWERSASMLRRAKKNLAQAQLHFYQGDFTQSDLQTYDEIWLHFVLDTIPDEDMEIFLQGCLKRLKPDGNLILADFFEPVHWKQKLVHGLMLIFFRVFTSHPRQNTPDYALYLGNSGFTLVSETRFRKGWIRSQLWRPSSPRLPGQ
ncbi:class I SAM-dependent methyltransferase [Algoriphagus namhaensis]